MRLRVRLKNETLNGWNIVTWTDHNQYGWKEIERWCREMYGEDDGTVGLTTAARWYDWIRFGEIGFREDSDLMLFVLKYSSED